MFSAAKLRRLYYIGMTSGLSISYNPVIITLHDKYLELITSEISNPYVSENVRGQLFVVFGRTRQTLWEECTDANPKLSLNDT